MKIPFIDKFIKRNSAKVAHRSFAGGGNSPIMAFVDEITTAMNRENHISLKTMRRRSRAAAINDPYIAKFNNLVVDNVVGSNGMVLQCTTGDKAIDKEIERLWFKWCDNCDLTGRSDFTVISQSAIRSMARDGEFLVRLNTTSQGLRLQALDTNRIYTELNDPLRNIVSGIELDAVGKPIAYHLFKGNPEDLMLNGHVVLRVPASEILHGFIPVWDEQVRGLPWIHASLVWLTQLNKYIEAAIVASRLGAAKMINYVQSLDSDSPIDATDIPTEISPNQASVLPPGVTMESFDPSYPHEQFESFTKAALKGLSSGLGVEYGDISNDRADANFSSMRTGSLSARDHWMSIQRIFIRQFVRPVFLKWLELQLLKGVVVGGRLLSFGRFEELSNHNFVARRWDWVDPLKDIQADIQACSVGLKNPYDIAAKMGGDLEDNLNAIARAIAYAKELDINLEFKKASSADTQKIDDKNTGVKNDD